jgi:hypothetical protein
MKALRMQNTCRSLAFLALFWLFWPPADAAPTATKIPWGVRYEPASLEAEQEAASRLQAALDKGPDALAQLFGNHDTRTNATIAGPFLGVFVHSLELRLAKVLEPYRYVKAQSRYSNRVEIPSFKAATLEQRRLLAQIVALLTRTSTPATIRAPNHDELAMAWIWASWDLSGPILVYETDREKWLFDFDKETGLITWIDRLTDPCLPGKPGDGRYLPCLCFKIFVERPAWYVDFDRKPVCKNPAGSSKAGKPHASSSNGADSSVVPHTAYIRTGEQTAHVDAFMIDAYQPEHLLTRLPENQPGYTGVGQRISGGGLKRPRDESGKPIHGYVLLGSIVNAQGQLVANRALLYTDPRLAEAAKNSVDDTRVEPARMQENPVAEAIWQQFEF